MAERIRRDGLASIIKYEGDRDTLIWKHPIEDFNLGSQLIVHESQEAIFFKDGQALDLFGPGRYTLETQQLPLLEKLYQLPTDTEATFHSEVYFINKTVQMALKWGTPEKVRFIDPLTGVLSLPWFLLLIAMYALETLVAFLQAYVFTVLSAVYVQIATSAH